MKKFTFKVSSEEFKQHTGKIEARDIFDAQKRLLKRLTRLGYTAPVNLLIN